MTVTVTPPTTVRQRLAALARAVAVTLVTACGLDTLTGSGDTVAFSLQGDSLLVVGASLQLAPQMDNGAALGGVRVAWLSSAPNVATVDSTGRITGRQAGPVTISAVVTAPELKAAGETLSVRLRVRYAGIVMTAVDSLTGLGQAVVPVVNGIDVNNAAVAQVVPVLTSSDPAVVLVNGASIVAKKNGTATISAAFDGYTDQKPVKVRQVAKRVVFGSSPFVFRALQRDTTVAVTALDTRDSVIPNPAVTWSSTNAAQVTVTSAGLLRALKTGAGGVRAVVDTAGATVVTSVSQTASAINKSAGDNQAQTAGAAVATLPTVTVTDAGGQPVVGAAVTFSVASGGGAITGATQATDTTGKATVGSWTLGTTAGANSLLASVGTLSVTFGATGNAGPASKLAIQQAPSGANAVGTALAPALQVTVRDANNNLVNTATTSITVAIGTNPGSATLGGTTTASAVAGVAAFGNLTVSAPGAGYTLTATASGLTSATTAAFTVFGPAAKLAFTVQPANVTAGSAIAPAIQVAVQDAGGNTITSATNAISLAIGTNPGSGTLTGGAASSASSGVASFSAVSIDRTGTGYTLTASASGLTGATSATFNVTPGAASKLVFLTQPSNTSPATAITPAVQVAVTDALGNTVTSSTATVAMAIGTNPGSGTLGGTTSVAAVAGVASFSTLQVNNVGTGYTLTASSGTLTGATSGAFNIVGAGTPRALKFVTQPSAVVAGANIAPAITVKVVDSVGTTVNGSTAAITLSFGANPNSGTLAGTLTVNASGGVATFSAVRVNRSGGGYTLAATSSGLTNDTSTAFAVSPGSAAVLGFTTQPTNAYPGAVIAPAVQVSVLDNQGNVVPSATNTITVAIGTNPGGATLGGTLGVAASNGVASFANLTVSSAANGYTLIATSTGLTGTTSTAFNVATGSAKALVFVTEPSNAVAGTANAPAITVKVVDSLGTPVSGAVPVTLAFGANPNGGTLSGTLTANTSGGTATFSNVRVKQAGSGYTLVATSTGLAPDTSAAFAISAAPASRLAFTVQPINVQAAAAITPAVQVSVTDSVGNVITSSTASIAVAVGTNPGGATLSGGAAVAATAGVASFASLSLDKVGTGYTLAASATGLAGATSAAFNVIGGPPAQLAFTTQPATVNVNAAMGTVVVQVRDAGGNLSSGATMPVTLSLANNPGAATLGGNVTVSAVAGVATFTGLTVDKPGQGFTLAANAAGPGGPLTAATSNAFNAIGPATALFFTTQPSGQVKNTTIAPSVVVEARDAAGNRASGYTGAVAMAIQNNAGPGGTLAGTTSRNASAGVATFNDLSIDVAGTGYTLSASASALTGATSAAFDIAAFGSASRLAFKTQPSTADANAAISPVVEVEIQDASGNRVTSSSAAVTMSFGANPGASTLGGTNPVNAVNGVAQFTTLSVSNPGTAYTLTANASGLVPVTSNAFNIVTPGSAVRLRFDVQPTSTTAGSQIAPALVVSAVNSSGNVVAGASGLVSLAVDSGPVFGGLGQVSLVNGQATFSTVALTVAGNYRLQATGASLAKAVSSQFTITHGFATSLGITTPNPTIAGNVLPNQIRVTVQDQYGNRVFTAGNTIRIGWYTSGNTSGCIDGDTIHPAVQGLATFTQLRIRCTGGPGGTVYISANTSGLSQATTGYIAVNPSPPAYLWFDAIPTSTTGRQPFAACVTVRDSIGNFADPGQTITLSLASNPVGGHIGGTTSAASTWSYYACPNYQGYRSGIQLAPFIDSLGVYTVTASSPGLASITSGGLTIVPSSATQLGFVVPPANAKAGAIISPTMRVCVLDAYGNEVRTATGSVTLSIGVNPGSATLGGTLTRTVTNGCATFNDITVSAVGSGYALLASPTNIGGVSSVSYSPSFDITP